jgi:hypothetical protein
MNNRGLPRTAERESATVLVLQAEFSRLLGWLRRSREWSTSRKEAKMTINPEHRREANKPLVVQRLRASKIEFVEEALQVGREAGRAWASDEADYPELRRIAKIWKKAPDDIDLLKVKRLIDPHHELSTLDFNEVVGCGGTFEDSDECAKGFARGAAEVYDEVKDEID